MTTSLTMGLVYIEYISRLPGIDLEDVSARQAAQGPRGMGQRV